MPSDLSPEERKEAVDSLLRYLDEELEVEMSDFQAGFLLDFFLKEIGPFPYNRGVENAKSFFMARAEDLGGICFEEPLTHWKSSGGSNQVRRKSGY